MSDTSEAGNRTEQATPHRLQKAREEGSVPRAHTLAGAAVLVAGAVVLAAAGTKFAELLEGSVRAGLSLDPLAVRDPAQLSSLAYEIARPAVTILAPFLILMAVVAFAADLMIGGWMVSTRPLLPDFSRIDPLKGLGRLFSRDGLAEIVKALVKFVLVAVIAMLLLRSRLSEFVHIGAATWPRAAQDAANAAAQIFVVLSVCLALATGLEVPYQLWSFRTRLRMTRQELRDETRDIDGSPQTKRRIRSLRAKMARGRMMAEVPQATVVITNPQHYAAALKYSEGTTRAPQLVAKGTGLVALRIRELAAEHQIPVIEAPPLARAICRYVELTDEIPVALYGAVAEVLAYVYRLRAARDTGQPIPAAPQDGRFEPPPELEA